MTQRSAVELVNGDRLATVQGLCIRQATEIDQAAVYGGAVAPRPHTPTVAALLAVETVRDDDAISVPTVHKEDLRIARVKRLVPIAPAKCHVDVVVDDIRPQAATGAQIHGEVVQQPAAGQRARTLTPK